MNEYYWSANLKFLRKKLGKSQADICFEIGFAVSQWSNWESKNVFPVVNDMIKISNYFGIKIDDLIFKELSNPLNTYVVGIPKPSTEETAAIDDDSEKAANARLIKIMAENSNNAALLISYKNKEIDKLNKELEDIKNKIKTIK